jgi:uncharacterized protein
MHSHLKKAAVLVTGWMFIAGGIIGLFLPFLQGILFILIGLLILSSEYVWAHRLLQRVRQKFPKLSHVMDAAEKHGREWMRKITGRRGRTAEAVGDD